MTFDEWWKSDDCIRTVWQIENVARKAWETALKANKEPGAEVPGGDGLADGFMNLTCPDCSGEMVRYRYENPEGDWIFGWACDCNEETRANRKCVADCNVDEKEKEIHPKCKICRSFNGDMEEPGCWLQKGTPDYLGEKCDFLQRGVS